MSVRSEKVPVYRSRGQKRLFVAQFGGPVKEFLKLDSHVNYRSQDISASLVSTPTSFKCNTEPLEYPFSLPKRPVECSYCDI